jgi:hypothetical protein
VKIIKAISQPRFAVELVETEAGEYRIRVDTQMTGEVISEPIQSLDMALQFFDQKVIEVEGH